MMNTTNSLNNHLSVQLEVLREENARLNCELLFANKCVNILMKFKSFIKVNQIDIINALKQQKRLHTSFLNELIKLEFELNAVISEKNQKKAAVYESCDQTLEEESDYGFNFCDNSIECCDNSFKETISSNKKQKIKSTKTVFVNENTDNNTADSNDDCTRFTRNSNGKIIRRRVNYRKGENEKKMDKAIEYYNQHKDVETIISISRKFGITYTALRKRIGDKPKVIKRYACEESGCERRFANHDDFVSHMIDAHDINIFKCTFDGCEVVSKDKWRFKAHQKSHSKINECDNCNENSNETANIIQNLNDNSTNVFANESMNFDDTRFARNNKGEIVVRRRKNYRKGENGHKMDKAIEYYNQRKSFETIMSIARRFKINYTALRQRVGKKPKVIKRYACDESGCERRFANENDFASHMITEHDINIYKCKFDGCDAVTKSMSQFKVHQKCHSIIKPFVCEWPGCDYKTAYSGSIATHRKYHIGIKFVCSWPECTAVFNLKSDFKDHIDKHEGFNQFLCPWPECDSYFSNDKHFNRHLLLHKGESKFRCEWTGCDKRFNLIASMYSHMKCIHQKNLNI